MAPSLPVVAITGPQALNRPTGQVGADSGLNHPVRSPLESLRGKRSWELGGRLPGALKGPPRILLSTAPCPPKLWWAPAGIASSGVVCPAALPPECRPCLFPQDPCPEPALEPYGGGRLRTPFRSVI